MKTNSIVTIKRGNKTIVIYVNDGVWEEVPDLTFIADVEVYDNKEEILKELTQEAQKMGLYD